MYKLIAAASLFLIIGCSATTPTTSTTQPQSKISEVWKHRLLELAEITDLRDLYDIMGLDGEGILVWPASSAILEYFYGAGSADMDTSPHPRYFSGKEYLSFMRIQFDKHRRGEMSKDEVDYAVLTKAKEYFKAFDDDLAREDQRMNEQLKAVQSQQSGPAYVPFPVYTAPLYTPPPQPRQCISNNLGGMVLTNCY